MPFEYFCWQLGSTVAKKGCKVKKGRKIGKKSSIPNNEDLFSLRNNWSEKSSYKVKTDSNKNNFEDSFKSIHYYIVIGVIIVLLAFTTATVVSYRYLKRQEKTPDPITVEESVGEPEELGAKKFNRDLSGTTFTVFP